MRNKTTVDKTGEPGGWGRRLRSSLLGGMLMATAGSAVAAPPVPGSRDTSFYIQVGSYSFFEGAYTTVVLPNGNIVLGGWFELAAPNPVSSFVTRNNMAMFTKAGALTAFDPDIGGTVSQIVLQPDGKMLIQGDFYTVGGVWRDGFARLNADGTLDTAFDPAFSPTGKVTAAVQPDGKILVGGAFTSVDGTARNRIARLNADGTLDTGFNPNANGDVSAILVQPDGKIYVQGSFTGIGGGSRNYHARLNAEGTLDTSFTATSTARGFVVQQADGKFLVADITSVIRLNADGSNDTGYTAPAFPDYVLGGALQADGKLLLGGAFKTPKDRIGRLLPSGAVDTAFVSPTSSLGTYRGDYVNMPWGAALQADGRVLVHGNLPYYFTAAGRLMNEEMTEALRPTSGSRVEWLRARTAPEAEWVIFDVSADGGSTWTALGQGSRISGGWELTGVTVPGTGILRARASVASGVDARSRGMVESRADLGKEILVEGNGVPILDGHRVPLTDTDTIFGDVRVRTGTAVKTYTIKNSGSSNLTVSGITFSGAAAAEYAVGGISLPATVAAGGSQTFTVTFDPNLRGEREAVVNIASDDADEAVYDFAVTGRGIDPELTVNLYSFGPTLDLSSGSTRNFGSLLKGSSDVAMEFQIKNIGDAPLELEEMGITGTHAGRYALAVGTSFPHTLAINGTLNFTVTFDPDELGINTAKLDIENDDSDEAGYYLNLTGTVVQPDISVSGNGTVIAMGDSTPNLADHTDFGGATLYGEAVESVYTITNTGTSPLSVSSITLGGTFGGDFTLSGITLPTTVHPGLPRTFKVTFDPSADTTRNAVVTVTSDAPGKAVYAFAIEGKCVESGDVDLTFALGATGGSALVNCTAEQTDGKVLVGGVFSTFGGVSRSNIARYKTDNTVDTAFAASTDGEVHCISVQPDDGKILIGGDFTVVNGVANSRVARLNPDGTLDTTFNAGVDGIVTGIHAARDGSILICGEFSLVNATGRTFLARLEADGDLDTSFSTVFDDFVRCFAVQDDGKIIAGGLFSTVNSVSQSKIVRLESDGTLDTGFTASVSTSATDVVECLALLPDGSVILGGTFSTVNGVARSNLAKVEADGTLDSFLTAGCTGGPVHSVVLDAYGDLLVGGAFSDAGVYTAGGSVSTPNLARIKTLVNLVDGYFNDDNNVTGIVRSVALGREGNIVIGGTVSVVNGVAVSNLARLHNIVGVESISAVPLGDSVTWYRDGGAPEVTNVTLEYAASPYDPWSSLGTVEWVVSEGYRVSPTDFVVPLHGVIRVRGFAQGGKMGGSKVPVEIIHYY